MILEGWVLGVILCSFRLTGYGHVQRTKRIEERSNAAGFLRCFRWNRDLFAIQKEFVMQVFAIQKHMILKRKKAP